MSALRHQPEVRSRGYALYSALASSSQSRLPVVPRNPQVVPGVVRNLSQDTTGGNANSELVRSDAQRRTIYALSTPPGKAGIAVIRISGPDALDLWRSMVSIYSRKGKGRELDPEPWKMYRCDVSHPKNGELLDTGLAVYFKGKLCPQYSCISHPHMYSGPKSFTGEDVVELHVHSGRAIISSILDALALVPTCRLAEPGEFTRRAFEAGRLDLTEVEGLHDLINAETATQRRAALQAVGVCFISSLGTRRSVYPFDRLHLSRGNSEHTSRH